MQLIGVISIQIRPTLRDIDADKVSFEMSNGRAS